MSFAYEEKAEIIQSRSDLSEETRRMEIERLIDVAKAEYNRKILILKAQLPRGLGLFLSEDKKRSRKEIRHATAMLEIAKRNEVLSLELDKRQAKFKPNSSRPSGVLAFER